MRYHNNEGEMYLKNYPQCQKWINECIICHTKGYKSDMPDYIINKNSNIFNKHIKKYFNELEVNEFSICKQCSKLYKF